MRTVRTSTQLRLIGCRSPGEFDYAEWSYSPCSRPSWSPRPALSTKLWHPERTSSAFLALFTSLTQRPYASTCTALGKANRPSFWRPGSPTRLIRGVVCNRIASELHEALRSARETPPFLMVGHSYGGFNVRVFNGKYPDEVAAILLVDATHEDQYRLLPPAWAALGAATRLRARKQAFWAPLTIGLGITRLQLRLQGREAPPVLLQSKYLQARTSELENIEESAEQARAAGHIIDKPLMVLTAGKPIDIALRSALSPDDQKAFEQTWINELQVRLVRLSSLGKRVIVPDTGHDIPSERPDTIVAGLRELCKCQGQP